MKPDNINDYHSEQPEDVQVKLQQLRKAIKQAAPKATETISYGMPAFKQNKRSFIMQRINRTLASTLLRTPL
jgi:uncharacterized protein YdhG (YjbR/CyaY superfamily)